MLGQRVEVGRKQAEDLCIRKFSLDTDKASNGGLSGGVMSTTIGLGATEFAILAPPQVCPTQMPSADAKSALNHPRKVALQGLCLYDLDPGKIYCVMALACLSEQKKSHAIQSGHRGGGSMAVVHVYVMVRGCFGTPVPRSLEPLCPIPPLRVHACLLVRSAPLVILHSTQLAGGNLGKILSLK